VPCLAHQQKTPPVLSGGVHISSVHLDILGSILDFQWIAEIESCLHGQGQPANAGEGTARDTAHQGCPEMVALFANVVSFITG
jgi:hypothetical protein